MESYTCQKCGKTMNSSNFFTYKNGEKTEMCKKCLTMHVDNYDENTYLWLLEKMDVPYIPEEWAVLRDRAFAKNPYKMNGMSVFGTYLAKMRLIQFKNYGWADSEKLQAKSEERRKIAQAEMERTEARIKEQYENGEIVALSDEKRQAALGMNKNMADRALRVLAVGIKVLDSEPSDYDLYNSHRLCPNWHHRTFCI